MCAEACRCWKLAGKGRRKLCIDQKSREVAGERGMSQTDLLLDRDSSLRVELQLQPSVSALEGAHALNNMQEHFFCMTNIPAQI